ncbi:MAG: hypothetical protein M1823_000585 [Watsoniomyces obsoletus]|nr:MAG: hypothetical protein M1823_000585 [Watsoniomyces obsoletus]
MPPIETAEVQNDQMSDSSEEVMSVTEGTPGAEIKAHYLKGDLLAVAAPLALRKRTAEHLESENEDERPLQDVPAPAEDVSRPKRVKSLKLTEPDHQETVGKKSSEKNKKTTDERKTLATKTQVAKTPNKKQGAKEAGKANDATMSKMSTRSQKKQKSPAPAGDEDGDMSDDDEEDHTDAFLKGFESSDSEDPSGDEGFKAGQEVPRIPKVKGVANGSANGKKTNEGQKQSGVLYIGRIPHGFYEREMRAYFSQFGELTHLRLARNRRTGNSKHYAFLEFASPSVADITARTMNNYLLFGHILKVHVIPTEQIPPHLWKGEGKRNRPVPWNVIERNKLAKPKPRMVWTKKIEVVTKSRQEKAKQLKAIGYDFEMPILKKVGSVGTMKKVMPAAVGTENAVPGASATSKTFQGVLIPSKTVKVQSATEDQGKGGKKASKAKGKSRKTG